MSWKGFQRKRSYHVLDCYLGIYSEGLRSPRKLRSSRGCCKRKIFNKLSVQVVIQAANVGFSGYGNKYSVPCKSMKYLDQLDNYEHLKERFSILQLAS